MLCGSLGAVLVSAALVLAAPAKPDPGYLAELVARARADHLASSRPWRVLVHYRAGWFGGWRSDALGSAFFLAGRAGAADPEAELLAMLTGLFAPVPAGKPDESVQCRFPARFAWLKDALGVDARRLPDRACPELARWRASIGARGVTLVYASAYLNSPASMYGHTFLRFPRRATDDEPLLDYAASFAADADTRNGFAYAWNGVTGGFAGRFSVLPYYLKVQEYSNIEGRDLWEYDLALSDPEIERLVMHLWELQAASFDYYFFTRNCAYQLLTLLEVARPTMKLVDGFSIRVIPSDTVRILLAQRGLIRAQRVRPSLLSRAHAFAGALTRPETNVAARWATLPERPSDASVEAATAALFAVPPERRALVLDAAYAYARYERASNHPVDGSSTSLERRLLLARGQLGGTSPDLEVRANVDAPERGHATLRLAAGGGLANESGSFETLGIRFAVHDYLDASAGYPEDAQLQMGNVRLRYANRDGTPGGGAVRLDRLDAIDIFSGAPQERWLHRLSWRVWAGAENARELDCERPTSDRHGWRCLYGGLSTGTGVAARFGRGPSLLVSLLAVVDVGAGPAFVRGDYYRLGGGGLGLATLALRSNWRVEAGAQATFYALGERHDNLRAHAATALSLTNDLELRTVAERAGSYEQLSAELCAFY